MSLTYIFLVEEWFNRSRQLPLAIHVSFSSHRQYHLLKNRMDLAKLMKPLLTVIQATANRWSHFFARLPLEYMEQLQPQLVQPASLQVLVLQSADYSSRRIENLDFKAFSPLMLRIDSGALRNLTISWSQLTQASANGLTPVQCLHLLREATQLKRCTFKDLLYGPPPQNSLYVHAQLKALRILDEYAMDVLQHLTLPSLTTIEVDLDGGSFASYLSPFINRSGCKLEEAYFVESHRDDEDLLNFLRLVPSLIRLGLKEMGDDFLIQFGATSFQSSHNSLIRLLPNLQIFVFQGYRDFSWPSVAASIPIGAPYVARRPLKSFTLETVRREGEQTTAYQRIDEESLKIFADIIASGVKLEITDFDLDLDLIGFNKTLYEKEGSMDEEHAI